ncbi:MAG TPA: holdfast anchoring protein HfaB [Caulobacteraceae bacterium]|jgi:curli production assembly/transport component CsgG/holdfast attachment protein HfaB|nr:holdfast anchoring protein HfaB [Caulobacteraceae bacterium]
MARTDFRPARVLALVAASAVALSGCVSPVAGSDGLYAQPMGNAPVTPNPTPYSQALVCLGDYARAHNLPSPRIAVGRISDYTAKDEPDGGRKLTQGASLMAMSALAKSGARLVERYDTSISELELKYANNKLITDAPDATPGTPAPYRHITSGQVPGSDFYIVGGITELNYNIKSAGFDIAGGGPKTGDLKAEAGGQIYVMNVGLDLRLVSTRTLEVVDVVSYQKQIIARQVGVGAFQIINHNGFEPIVGEAGMEPIQLAVRSTVERAVLEMMANLYGAPGPQVCLDSRRDPLATTGVTGGFTPAYDNRKGNNGSTRADPARWSADRDADVKDAKRGRY